eukprot:9043974-Pyramimonas_sp.AAC.1
MEARWGYAVLGGRDACERRHCGLSVNPLRGIRKLLDCAVMGGRKRTAPPGATKRARGAQTRAGETQVNVTAESSGGAPFCGTKRVRDAT